MFDKFCLKSMYNVYHIIKTFCVLQRKWAESQLLAWVSNAAQRKGWGN